MYSQLGGNNPFERVVHQLLKESLTVMVNHSTDINETNYHLSP